MLKYTHEAGVATLILANPPQNRLSGDVIQGLAAAVQAISTRNDTRALLLLAEGPDFSFGGDLNAWIDLSETEFRETIAQGLALTSVFENFPFPIVAGVQGYCGGGGFEIALRSDIIIAAENARFCHSEASISAFTFLGGIQRVADRVGRTRAMQWALTAEEINAQTALGSGLINEISPVRDLEAVTRGWVSRFKDSATLSHAAHKKLLRAWSDGGVASADALMADMAGKILHSQDAQECLNKAAAAVSAGLARPQFTFKGK